MCIYNCMYLSHHSFYPSCLILTLGIYDWPNQYKSANRVNKVTRLRRHWPCVAAQVNTWNCCLHRMMSHWPQVLIKGDPLGRSRFHLYRCHGIRNAALYWNTWQRPYVLVSSFICETFNTLSHSKCIKVLIFWIQMMIILLAYLGHFPWKYTEPSLTNILAAIWRTSDNESMKHTILP